MAIGYSPCVDHLYFDEGYRSVTISYSNGESMTVPTKEYSFSPEFDAIRRIQHKIPKTTTFFNTKKEEKENMTPSKKDIIYKLWKKDPQTPTWELAKEVSHLVKESTINKWRKAWEKGKLIPRMSAEEELREFKSEEPRDNQMEKNRLTIQLTQAEKDLASEKMENKKKEEALQELKNQLKKKQGNRKITLVAPDGKKKILRKKRHPAYEDVIMLASLRKNIFIPGPAGCGKSYLASQVAHDLGLPYYFINCSAGMSEGHLTGRLLPVGEQGTFDFVTSGFVSAYEEGGLFCADELDAADPNVLLIINTAIANGVMTLNNRIADPVIKKHPDFVLLACANTYGRGSDRLYVGRNQLDEATLDRFRIGTVPMDYDDGMEKKNDWNWKQPNYDQNPVFNQRFANQENCLEKSICPDNELRKRMLWYRDACAVNRLERIVSTRFLIDALEMKTKAEWDDEKIDRCLFSGWSLDEIKLMDCGA